MQKCKPPSFFLTSTTVLHQVLWLGLMAPDSNISLRWFLTSSTIGGGICLNHSLNGVSSVILWYAWLSGYILALPDLMRICCDIQQGAGGLYLPTRGPMNLSRLDLTHQTAYHVFP